MRCVNIIKSGWAPFFAFLLAALSPDVHAAGSCSVSIGAAVLNEYAHQANYVEVKKLAAGQSFSSWKVRIYTSTPANTATCGSGCSEQSLPTSGTDLCGNYQVTTFKSNQVSTTADVVLLDANNDVVDILRARSATGSVSTLYPRPACSYVGPTTDLPGVSNSQKGVDRLPDGTGAWRNTPGTGANSYLTQCAANTPDQTTYANLGLSKSVISGASIAPGGNATFRLTVSNAGPNTATSLQVVDTLPAGLAYGSSTAPTIGTFDATNLIWSISSLASGSSASMDLTVTVPSAGTYTNTATAASDNVDSDNSNNTATASITASVPSPGDPSAFAAYETSISDANAATAGNQVIRTRVASASGNLCTSGNVCSLAVAAFDAGAIKTTYNGSVTASLESCTNISRSSGVVSCSGAWSAISGASQSVTLTSGKGTLTFAAVANAYEMVRVKISSATVGGGPWTPTATTSYFAIRPASLTVTATDATASTAGTARSLTSGLNSHKAGRPFTLNAQASNYPGTSVGPVIKTYATSMPAGGATGVLTLGTWSGTGGTATSNTASYTEAGVIDLALEDRDYANIDSSDSSTTERYFSGSASLGRFTPDHFAVTPGALTQGCASGGFTYYGQAFSTVFTLTAQNAANATTLNYTGSLAKLDLLSWSNYSFAASGVTLLTSGTAPTGSWINGVANINASHTVQRATSGTPTSPADIRVTVKPVDSDDVTLPTAVEVSSFVAPHRFGRLRLSNTVGSELLPLPMPLTAQYWNGFAFIRNDADTCTSLSAANLGFTFPSGSAAQPNNLQACETALTITGSAPVYSLSLSAPGGSNIGWADLTLNLAGSSSGVQCLPGAGSGAGPLAIVANLPFLQYNWVDTSGFDDNPSARATFGKRKGADKVIIRREIY